MRRFLAIAFLVALFSLTVFGAIAWAADGTTSTTVADLTQKAQLIALAGGVLIPFAVALLAKARASMLVKSMLAAVSAGLLALGTYLTNTGGATTWRGAGSVFVLALITAAASRVTLTGGADTALQAKTHTFGVG